MSDPLEEPDDLQRLIGEKMRDPDFRNAYDDRKVLSALMDKLVSTRRSRITQIEMAKRLNIKQASVSQFEAETSDPRLSTLQRYARALGGEITIDFIDNPLADLPPRTTT